MDSTCCTPEQMALIGITAEQIALAFGFGFGTVVTHWFFGWCIGAAKRAIDKL